MISLREDVNVGTAEDEQVTDGRAMELYVSQER